MYFQVTCTFWRSAYSSLLHDKLFLRDLPAALTSEVDKTVPAVFNSSGDCYTLTKSTRRAIRYRGSILLVKEYDPRGYPLKTEYRIDAFNKNTGSCPLTVRHEIDPQRCTSIVIKIRRYRAPQETSLRNLSFWARG